MHDLVLDNWILTKIDAKNKFIFIIIIFIEFFLNLRQNNKIFTFSSCDQGDTLFAPAA